MENKTDKTKLKEIIEYLQDEPNIDESRYPEYDGRIYELLSSLGTDINYLDNYAEIENKDIDTLNLNELMSVYTFIIRGERFCPGHIASFIKDGTMLKLAKRHFKLLEEIK